MITTTIGKRPRKKKATTRVTRPFRPPRSAQRGVIPGLLYQTKTEKKVLFVGEADATNGVLACNTTGSIIALNLIQVGSSMFNRIGRKIEMRSLRFIGQYLTTNAGGPVTTVDPDYHRLAIVYDRQTNGALPTLSDMFQDTEQTGTNTSTSLSGVNMNNRERFVVLMDKRITLPQGTATAGVLTNVFPNDVNLPIKVDEFRRLRGLTTHYGADSSPAVIGDIRTGGLYIVSFTNIQAAGTEIFSMNWNVRLKYTDV